MPNKLAIITVHYGETKNLFKTINSIDLQTEKPDKHIIVSKKFINIKKNKKYRTVIFNKDKSLYDAMNIGQSKLKNFNILFLNSGDIFFSNNSIWNIKVYSRIYRNKCIVFKTLLKNGKDVFEPNKKYFNSSSFLQHPSFVAPIILNLIKFNDQLSILSDGFWMNENIKKYKYKKINKKISILELGGISSKPNLKLIIESFTISITKGIKELLKIAIFIFLSKKKYYQIIYKNKYNVNEI